MDDFLYRIGDETAMHNREELCDHLDQEIKLVPRIDIATVYLIFCITRPCSGTDKSPTVKLPYPQARQEPKHKNIKLIASKQVNIIYIWSETTVFPNPCSWFSGHSRPDRQFASLHARPDEHNVWCKKESPSRKPPLVKPFFTQICAVFVMRIIPQNMERVAMVCTSYNVH